MQSGCMTTLQTSQLWYKQIGEIDTHLSVPVAQLRKMHKEHVRNGSLPAGALVFSQNVGSEDYACVYALYTGDKRTAIKYGMSRLSLDWIPPLGI